MRLGSRAKLTIGVGIAAAVGFAYLGFKELSGPTQPLTARAEHFREREAPPQALLAAATRTIKTGETITADMIRSAAADPMRHPMVATPAEVIGKVATRNIPANALIARTATGTQASLAIRVPLGMRAISIDTTAEIAVAGLLRPGDTVDVQVVYPGADAISGARGIGRSHAQTLLQMVQVLAVGDMVVGAQPATTATDGTTASSAPPAAAARTVTLALFPDQVSTLSLAKSTGALHLSLRNPGDDAQLQVARQVSAGPLPERPSALVATPAILAQQRSSAPPAPVRPRPAPHAIDLVVGGNHEVIYSGSGSR